MKRDIISLVILFLMLGASLITISICNRQQALNNQLKTDEKEITIDFIKNN